MGEKNKNKSVKWPDKPVYAGFSVMNYAERKKEKKIGPFLITVSIKYLICKPFRKSEGCFVFSKYFYVALRNVNFYQL